MGAAMNRFVEHPHAVGETYTQHMAMAAWFGVRLIAAGLACLVHAVFPFLCVTTGSARVRALFAEMTQRQTVAQSRSTAGVVHSAAD